MKKKIFFKKLYFYYLILISFQLIHSQALGTSKKACEIVFDMDGRASQIPQILNTSLFNQIILQPKPGLLNELSTTSTDTSAWSVLIRTLRTWVVVQGHFQHQVLVNSKAFYRQESWTSQGHGLFRKLEVISFPHNNSNSVPPAYWGMKLTVGDLQNNQIQSVLAITVSTTPDSPQIQLVIHAQNAISQSEPVSAKNSLILSLQTTLFPTIYNDFSHTDDLGIPVSSDKAHVLNKNNLAQFVEKLQLPTRTLPIVLISKQKSETTTKLDALNPHQLAKYLHGLAEVYLLPDTASLNKELEEKLGSTRYLLVQNGDLRIIAHDNPRALTFVPFAQIVNHQSQDQIFTYLKRILLENIKMQLSNPTSVPQLITTLEQIAQLKEQYELSERISEFELKQIEIQNHINEIDSELKSSPQNSHLLDLAAVGLTAKMKELKGLFAQIFSLLTSQQQNLFLKHIESLEDQLTILNDDIKDIQETAKLKNALASKTNKHNTSAQKFDLENPPTDFKSMLESITQQHPGKIVFAIEALNGHKDLKSYFIRPANKVFFFKLLNQMATTLRDLYLKRPGDIETEFLISMRSQKIPFDSLARGESSSVMVNNGLRKQRHGTYEGTNYEGYAHIRYDGPNNERFRIHFQYDSKKQRIVVTRITLHLDSASPKKP